MNFNLASRLRDRPIRVRVATAERPKLKLAQTSTTFNLGSRYEDVRPSEVRAIRPLRPVDKFNSALGPSKDGLVPVIPPEANAVIITKDRLLFITTPLIVTASGRIAADISQGDMFSAARLIDAAADKASMVPVDPAIFSQKAKPSPHGLH